MLQEYTLFLAGVKGKVRGTLRQLLLIPMGAGLLSLNLLTTEHRQNNVNWFSQAKQ